MAGAEVLGATERLRTVGLHWENRLGVCVGRRWGQLSAALLEIRNVDIQEIEFGFEEVGLGCRSRSLLKRCIPGRARGPQKGGELAWALGETVV